MSTKKITLAKALKLKNRLAGRLAKLKQEITSYNSAAEGSERPDVSVLYKQWQQTREFLLDVKFAIYTANSKIQRIIFELAELKGEKEWMEGLNTRHGKIVEYGETETNYVAVFRKTDTDKASVDLERRIDEMQESLDRYNHSTEVEVPAAALAPLEVVQTTGEGVAARVGRGCY